MKSLEFPDQDEQEDIREARELWQKARTLTDACELTAAWMEGVIAFNPGSVGGPIDKETGPIAVQLAQINRLRLWTQESQPGEDSPEWRQREFVHGLCEEATARKLEELSNRSDLVTLSFWPGTPSFGQIPASCSPEASASLHLGASSNFSDPDGDSWQVLLRDTTKELTLVAAGLREVQIFDPVWGRTGLLFPSIIEALSA